MARRKSKVQGPKSKVAKAKPGIQSRKGPRPRLRPTHNSQLRTHNSFDFVKEKSGLREFRLKSNQLRLLLLQNRIAPVVTFAVVYHVGSRNEAVGYTGATHLLEHLMFKGTPRYNRERGTAIAAVLEALGARFNATTWFDRTNYYETLPSARLERGGPDRGLAHARVPHPGRGPAARDDGRAQRVRARRELSLPGPLQAHVRGGLSRAPVPPPDDRLEERHRGGHDRPPEGVLRRLLPSQQRDRDGDRGLRGERSSGDGRAPLRLDSSIGGSDPAGAYRRAAAGRRAALHGPARRPGRLVRARVADGPGASSGHARARGAGQHPGRRRDLASLPGARREEPRPFRHRRAVAASRPGPALDLRAGTAGSRARRRWKRRSARKSGGSRGKE